MTLTTPTVGPPALTSGRLRLMRGGYLLTGVGLVLVKWPLLPDAHALSVYEGPHVPAQRHLAAGLPRPAVPAVTPWQYVWRRCLRLRGDGA